MTIQIAFATPTFAAYVRRVPGRTSPPPTYRLVHSTPQFRTLASPTHKSKPHHIHIIPVVHADSAAAQSVEHALLHATPSPDLLVLELCSTRLGLLRNEPDEPNSTVTTDTPRPSVRTFLEAYLSSQVAALENIKSNDSSSRAKRGAEMRHAVHVWETVLRKQHNQIVLGDKRVDHVIKQWAAHASWLEKLTLAVDASLAPIVRWFQPDILEALGSEEQIAIWRDRFRRRAPAAYRAICVERELHMAWCVRDSAAAINAESVALVCGVLHAKEIEMLLHQGRRVDIKKLTRMST